MPISQEADGIVANGNEVQVPTPPPAAASAKGKGKQKPKPVDSNEASKLLQARISQLEQDAAGEKNQEAEIEREVKRANRDLLQQVSKLEPMEKIDHLLKRCSELATKLRRATRENKNNKIRGDNLQKDKDYSRAELTKTVGLKEKLEKLCRELQRDNNKLKSDYKALQNSHKDSQDSWDRKFANLLSKLEGCQEAKDNPQIAAINHDIDGLFRQRFTTYIEQSELRELHYHGSIRSKELEAQHANARYEREKQTSESEAARARQLQTQVQDCKQKETELRTQLNVYIDKFKQVEDTLNNSNELFVSFRREMEDMSKKTKKLEKENDTLKRRHEATNSSVFRMAEEREEWKRRAEAAEKKTSKLMSIIQQMQQQGRKAPPDIPASVESCYSDSHIADVYSDFSEEPDGGETSEDADEKTPQQRKHPGTYGPEPPLPNTAQSKTESKSEPSKPAQPATNGH